MKQLLFSTDGHWAALILRLTLAAVMLPHGMQKVFGWFGGYGYKNTLNYFTGTMNFSWIIAFLIILIEFLAPVLLLAGFASRISALLLLVIMLGAIVTTNYQYGFFMNWFGNQAGEGFEYHLLVIGLCIAIIAEGSGMFSVDRLIVK